MAIKQILEVGADTGGYLPIQISTERTPKYGPPGICLEQCAEEYGDPRERIQVTWDQLPHLIAALNQLLACEFPTWQSVRECRGQFMGAGKGGEE